MTATVPPRPRQSSEGLVQEDLARGRRVLPDHLRRLDPAALFLSPPCWTTPTTSSAPAPTPACLGRLLDVVNALAGIGTAVALFPVVKRQNEGLALGFVTTRIVEAAVIMIGVVSLLAVVTLRQDVAGAPAPIRARSSRSASRWSRSTTGPSCSGRASLAARERAAAGHAAVPVRPRAPRHAPAGTHRSPPPLRLRRRGIVFEPGSASHVIATAPDFVWELSLGV